MSEVPIPPIRGAYPLQATGQATRNMDDIEVRRSPILTRTKRLVGIITLAAIRQREIERQNGRGVTSNLATLPKSDGPCVNDVAICGTACIAIAPVGTFKVSAG